MAMVRAAGVFGRTLSPRRHRIAALALLSLLGSHFVRADTPLAEGSVLLGAKQSFPVAVQGGQFLRLELEVNGRDFELSLFGPAGERLASARNMIREPRPLYAGAPRVVATLWPVPVATAELMKRFYHAMLADHVAPAAALRQAQESLRHEARWSAPYYWAAFTLQGDWR